MVQKGIIVNEYTEKKGENSYGTRENNITA